jgi:HEAT repeat protein
LQAARSLGNLGEKARLAVASLITTLENPREDVRTAALQAIRLIDPDSASRLGSR